MPHIEKGLFNKVNLGVGSCCAMTVLYLGVQFHNKIEAKAFSANIDLFNKSVNTYIKDDSNANLLALKETVYSAYNDHGSIDPNKNNGWISAASEAQIKLAKKAKWLALNELYKLEFDLRNESMGFIMKSYYRLKFKPTSFAKSIIGKDYPSSPFNENLDFINAIKNNWLIDKANDAQKTGKINTAYKILLEQASFSEMGFLNAYELAEFYGCSDLKMILSGLSLTDYSGDIKFYGSPLPPSEITLSNVEIETAKGKLRKGVLPNINASCPLANDY